MFDANELLRTVRVRAQSPDRTVTATVSAETGVRVRFQSNSLEGHNADKVAEAVRAAVHGALDGYERAADQVLRREQGEDAWESLRDSDAGRALRPYFEALERVDVDVVGEREVVKIGWVDGRFRVKLHPDALFLRGDVLAAEIDTTIKKMYEKRSIAAQRLYADLVDPEVSA